MTSALKWSALAGGLTAAAGAAFRALASRRGGQVSVRLAAPRARRRS